MQTRNILTRLYESAVKAADPSSQIRAHANHILSTHAHYGFRRTVLLAAGKAAPAMASALLDCTGGIIDKGLIVTGHGMLEGHDFSRYPDIEVMEASHPMPDGSSLQAARKAMDLFQQETRAEDTLVICLISGGASSLICAPAGEVLLEEKVQVIDALMRAGAGIHELNTVRKHLSAIKGGRLMEAAHPSMVISLIVSDVPDDDISAIASGPTAPDSTTASDALAVLDKYSISPLPATVLAQLLTEQRGLCPETPGNDNPIFDRTENIVIMNNRTALEGALNQARAFSLNAEVIEEMVTGDVAHAAVLMAAQSAERLKSENLPICLISGGETTSAIRGNGMGGRNMELALRFAMELEDLRGITMLSAGTDGIDGPTDAAGAIVDTNTIREAMQLNLAAEKYLDNSDSYNFFKQAGGLFITGPTGTNVMDIQLVIVGA